MLKIGHGYDVHRLVEGRKLIIGGVDIKNNKGLLGHTDADVLVHAIIDAILGALGMNDIGYIFPDTDDQYKDINSLELLKRVREIMKEKKYEIGNIDATIIAERPKLREYIDEMRKNIARACEAETEAINIKATTEEGLGFTGNEEGIAAHAVVIICN